MSTGSEQTDEQITLLTGENDMYSGVAVDENLLADTCELFERQLELSLKAWRDAKRRGIWLSIPANRTVLIPIAQKFGFVLHHATAERVMLTHWLDENEKNQLPSYAISTVGVGGMVVNSKREVLLVKERFAYIKDYFKLPGGAVDIGEKLEDAAIREVFEETGIRAKFRGILSFNYKTNFRFGHSDVYFACLMELPEDDQDQEIKFDPMEIADCKWISLDEWANPPNNQPTIGTKYLAQFAIDVLDGREHLLEPDLIEIKPKDPSRPIWKFTMYRNKTRS